MPRAPRNPQIGNVVMADTPEIPEEFKSPLKTVADDIAAGTAVFPKAPAVPLRHPAEITYKSRISILSAWRYPGVLADAPEWIDRSWTSWGEYDLQRKLEAGPALRVPTSSLASPQVEKLARIGDYVVRQNVAVAYDWEETGIDVWTKEEFERLFVPVDDAPLKDPDGNDPDDSQEPEEPFDADAA